MAAGSALFEDIFDVRERDPDGKYFDRGAPLIFVSGACLSSHFVQATAAFTYRRMASDWLGACFVWRLSSLHNSTPLSAAVL